MEPTEWNRQVEPTDGMGSKLGSYLDPTLGSYIWILHLGPPERRCGHPSWPRKLPRCSARSARALADHFPAQLLFIHRLDPGLVWPCRRFQKPQLSRLRLSDPISLTLKQHVQNLVTLS